MSRYRVVVLAPVVVEIDAFCHRSAGAAARERVARDRSDLCADFQPVVLRTSITGPAEAPTPLRA